MSREMRNFLSGLGIIHERVAMFRPQANGFVERINRMVMDNLQLSLANGLPWKRELKCMLWAHRVTAHSITVISLFVSMKGRETDRKEIPSWLKDKDRVWVRTEVIKEKVDSHQKKAVEYYNAYKRVK